MNNDDSLHDPEPEPNYLGLKLEEDRVDLTPNDIRIKPQIPAKTVEQVQQSRGYQLQMEIFNLIK